MCHQGPTLSQYVELEGVATGRPAEYAARLMQVTAGSHFSQTEASNCQLLQQAWKLYGSWAKRDLTGHCSLDEDAKCAFT